MSSRPTYRAGGRAASIQRRARHRSAREFAGPLRSRVRWPIAASLPIDGPIGSSGSPRRTIGNNLPGTRRRLLGQIAYAARPCGPPLSVSARGPARPVEAVVRTEPGGARHCTIKRKARFPFTTAVEVVAEASRSVAWRSSWRTSRDEGTGGRSEPTFLGPR